MKKTIYGVMLSVGLLLAFEKANAQISLGSGLDYNLIVGTGATPSVKFGGTYALGEGKRAVFANFSYFFPKTKNYSVSAYTLNSYTEPSSISVNVNNKITFYSISGGVRNYFGEGTIEDGGFFVSAGAGYVFGKQSFTYSTYDQTNYAVNGGTPDSEMLGDLLGSIGIGYDHQINDKMFIGAELPLAITMQGINSRTGTDSPIPIILSFGVNFRYALN